VLVAGGNDDNPNYLASAEIYDPAAGSWTATASLTTARIYHTATLLPNGTVLVAGGWNLVLVQGSNSTVSVATFLAASAEIYDPVAGTWTTTGSMTTARAQQTLAVVLSLANSPIRQRRLTWYGTQAMRFAPLESHRDCDA
jgi:hypothetical protein